MSNGIFNNVPHVIFTHNVSRTFTEAIAATTTANTFSVFEQTSMASTEIIPLASTDISPIACFGFVILILATVGGNTLVLLALYLDKRLHSPSFYLIANMAIADLLLGTRIDLLSHLRNSPRDCLLFRLICSAVLIDTGTTQRTMDLWTRLLLSMARTRRTLLYSIHHGSDGHLN